MVKRRRGIWLRDEVINRAYIGDFILLSLQDIVKCPAFQFEVR